MFLALTPCHILLIINYLTKLIVFEILGEKRNLVFANFIWSFVMICYVYLRWLRNIDYSPSVLNILDFIWTTTRTKFFIILEYSHFEQRLLISGSGSIELISYGA